MVAKIFQLISKKKQGMMIFKIHKLKVNDAVNKTRCTLHMNSGTCHGIRVFNGIHRKD